MTFGLALVAFGIAWAGMCIENALLKFGEGLCKELAANRKAREAK